VQNVLERAVREVVREPVILVGASRTDAGVHAKGQVAAFTTSREIPLERLPRAITGKLPDDVQVIRAAIVDEAFDPISDCVAKGYRYRIAHSCAHEGRVPLFDRHVTSWTPYRLDIERMREAAVRLVGTHDFASFTRMHHGRESTVRTVFECMATSVSQYRLRLDISGSGFLHNMIRIIAGTLIDIGRGKFAPDDVDRILEARDRAAAGNTFTPEGLCLMWVRYGGE
jgi:tRNA pseudouridine38-40 synthase